MMSRSRKPVIAVTGPDKGGLPAWIFLNIAVRRAGGKPLRITPSRIEKRRKKGLNFDALIISGGADIAPERYGGELDELRDASADQSEKSRFRWVLNLFTSITIGLVRKLFSLGHRAPIDKARDALEEEMLTIALEKQLPVLGICRGAQFINIHMGGTLHQSIDEFYLEIPKIDTVHPRKKIILEDDSHLSRILNAKETYVNSLHNQAVKVTGDNLRINAKEPTNVVQGIESIDSPRIIGIQWHPEYLPQIDRQQRLFRHIVELAKEKAIQS